MAIPSVRGVAFSYMSPLPSRNGRVIDTDIQDDKMMATWSNPEWPFTIYRGQQEFHSYAKFTPSIQCRNINKTHIFLTLPYDYAGGFFLSVGIAIAEWVGD